MVLMPAVCRVWPKHGIDVCCVQRVAQALWDNEDNSQSLLDSSEGDRPRTCPHSPQTTWSRPLGTVLEAQKRKSSLLARKEPSGKEAPPLRGGLRRREGWEEGTGKGVPGRRQGPRAMWAKVFCLRIPK